MLKFASLLLIVLYSQCNGQQPGARKATADSTYKAASNAISFDSAIETIHVMVALCDNTYQGIVPVPAKIGNGQNPAANLYWGCGYGVRSYFKKSSEWKLLRSLRIDSLIMERLVFRHASKNIYMIADAYNGKLIQRCTEDFLRSCAGRIKDTLHADGHTLGIMGNAKLLCYIGHDGLMDFSLGDTFSSADGKTRDCIILACVSKRYFSPFIRQSGANPLVWTTGLMCPEAYTLHDAIGACIAREDPESIRNKAAMAYSKYQHCSLKAARGLLVTGF